MPLVKVRICTVLGQVVGIWKNRFRTVRRIVDRVTVCVRNTKRKRALRSTEGNLGSVIAGISNVLEGKDLAKARGDHTTHLTQGIWYGNTCVKPSARGGKAIKHRRSRTKVLAIDGEGSRPEFAAKTCGYGLARCKRILRCIQRHKLIYLKFRRQMCSLAAHVRYGCQHIPG